MSQQIVEYIRSSLQAGHSEAVIRKHMAASGWSQQRIDAAFKAYRRAARPAKASRRGRYGKTRLASRPKGTNKWLRPKRLVLLVVVVAALVGILSILLHKTPPEPIPKLSVHLTEQQQQSIDVNTLGGAVGQYVATNDKTLPRRVSPALDGSSVVLCGTVCDPTTWQVSALQKYKPDGVKLVPFTPGMTVPDTATLYLASGAKCQPDGTPGVQETTALSMVILYATQEATGLKQHCVTL